MTQLLPKTHLDIPQELEILEKLWRGDCEGDDGENIWVLSEANSDTNAEASVSDTFDCSTCSSNLLTTTPQVFQQRPKEAPQTPQGAMDEQDPNISGLNQNRNVYNEKQ